jgi:hypothetical protein
MAFSDQANSAHDLARRAETALETVMRDEGSLDRVKFLALGKALYRGDLGPVDAGRKRKAGIDAPSVDEHGASAALAPVASLLGACQIKPLTQQVEQCHAWIVERDRVRSSIDC